MKHVAIHPFVAGLAANALGSLIGALLLTMIGYGGHVDSIGKFLGGTAAVTFYSFLIALPFVYLYGMPIYAALSKFGAANFATSIVVGSIPGLAWILWTNGSWIDPALWNGSLIAIVYIGLRRWCAWPSNSTPHSDAREAAVQIHTPDGARAGGRGR